MSGGIRLSQKHGVNPSITKCFWCGNDTGIALLGKLPGDVEAPRYVFGGYEPCDTCKGNFALGTLLMEASDCPMFDGQPEMQRGVWPTGRHLVMRREAAKRIFDCESEMAFVDHATFEWLTQAG